MSNLLQILKHKVIKVEDLSCDNASEHTSKLITICQKVRIELKYTFPSPPIYNGQFENNINLIWERAMTMIVHAKLMKETQVELWEESVNYSEVLVNVILKVDQNEPAVKYWTGDSVRNWFNNLV